MEDKKYIQILETIASEYLPKHLKNNPSAIFTASKNNAILDDLKNIKGKDYKDISDENNLAELARDAFEWNKFLLKKKYGINIDEDVKAGKYTEENAFKLTIIYGHKGAAKYLKESQATQETVKPVTINEIMPKHSFVTTVAPTTLIVPEFNSPQIQLTKKQKEIVRKIEQKNSYNAFTKLESGEVKSPIKRKIMIDANNLYDPNKHKIHSCFDDASYFNDRFGFTSAFTDPIEDTKHSINEVMDRNFSLAHWGFKNQNEHMQTSGFGAGIKDNSHIHKDFHLDQAFVNRAQLTTALENGKLTLKDTNINFHKLYANGNSVMANYGFADNAHSLNLHAYKAAKNNSGFVYGANAEIESVQCNMNFYAGYNKDLRNLSLEVSPVLTYVKNLVNDVPENNTKLGLRFSQSVPLSILSPKQNIGLMNSTILYGNGFENSSTALVNSNLFNLSTTYSFKKHQGMEIEKTFDIHAVYNPFQKFAIHGAYENEVSGKLKVSEYSYGVYYSPKNDLMMNLSINNTVNSNSETGEAAKEGFYNLGIHKILKNQNVISIEAGLPKPSPTPNLAPVNIQAKFNFKL